jgi:hypothetical protein
VTANPTQLSAKPQQFFASAKLSSFRRLVRGPHPYSPQTLQRRQKISCFIVHVAQLRGTCCHIPRLVVAVLIGKELGDAVADMLRDEILLLWFGAWNTMFSLILSSLEINLYDRK